MFSSSTFFVLWASLLMRLTKLVQGFVLPFCGHFRRCPVFRLVSFIFYCIWLVSRCHDRFDLCWSFVVFAWVWLMLVPCSCALVIVRFLFIRGVMVGYLPLGMDSTRRSGDVDASSLLVLPPFAVLWISLTSTPCLISDLLFYWWELDGRREVCRCSELGAHM